MALSSIFKIRQEATPSILELLNKTTLGTNGAMYKHLDTNTRILEADNPLFLSMERNEKTISNATFCRRGSNWYVRYFAFSSFAQAGTTKKSKSNGSSALKQELNNFFDEILAGKHSVESVHALYAYIDPRNDRSKWMSENLGFQKIGQLATQSYSRLYPKKSNRLQKLVDWNDVEPLVEKVYGAHAYFFTEHSKKSPIYILKDSSNAIIAIAKTTKVNWEIIRLPGKFGAITTKLVPFIPFLNKLIRPKKHTFLVPEIVYSENQDPKLINELFNGILFEEKCNLILWWVDEKDPLYTSIQSRIKWGFFHKLIGVNPVDVMERKNLLISEATVGPVFVSGWDLV